MVSPSDGIHKESNLAIVFCKGKGKKNIVVLMLLLRKPWKWLAVPPVVLLRKLLELTLPNAPFDAWMKNCLCPVGSDIEHYKMLKIHEPALDNRLKLLDVMCFPTLFPSGRYVNSILGM